MLSFDKNACIRPDIIAMKPYEPILPFEVISARMGRDLDEITKLDANENPYGMSPAAFDALTAGRHFHIYPDPESRLLREALSQYVDLPPERLLAGMGADELIDLVLRAVLSPGDSVIDCPPSFGMYPFSTSVNGGTYLPVPRRADFRLDLVAVEEVVAANPRAKVLFLCSPNNPDGGQASQSDLERLLSLPILVVLDEAYVEFASASENHGCISWVMRYENLVVLRTFSKWAGLAGMRVGYGAFPDWLLEHLWKIKQPYNVNVAATTAALASLKDIDWLMAKVRLIIAERERMAAALAELRFLQPFPSQANFVLCRVHGRDARQIKLALEVEGVLVRHFDKPGVDNCLRISVGRPRDTERLLAALHIVAESL